MSAPGKELLAFPCSTPGHGLMEPASLTSGLDPWLGVWWKCPGVPGPGGRCFNAALVPSAELEALWAEGEEEQRRLERKSARRRSAQMTIP